MPKVSNVVVPLDGSALAARAVAPAHALSEMVGATLTLMSTHWDDALKPAEAYLDEQAAELGADHVKTLVIHDRSAPDAISLEVQEPETVVCMATRGRSGVGATVLGSVAEEVVRRAHRPVLLIGPGVDRGAWQSAQWFASGQMLVPLDQSPASEAVLPVATEWSAMLDLRPWIVQAMEPTELLGGGDVVEVAYVRQIAEHFKSSAGAAQWEVLYDPTPAHAVANFARSLPATLIAMTTHSRTGVARTVMGSFATHVVHHSTCPVLIVRPPREG
jgi:nucleotide-binding universal stress UspA family protein